MKYFFTIFCFVSALGALAQPEGSVVIETTARPLVIESDKMDAPVQERIQKPEKPQVEFQTPVQPIATAPEPAQLRLPTFKEPIPELYRAGLQAGFGNYRDLILGAFYNSGRNKTGGYSLSATHHSGTGPIKPSGFGETRIAAQGKYNFSNLQAGANLGYTNNTLHYYGGTRLDTAEVDEDSLKQAFNTIDVGVSLKATQPLGEFVTPYGSLHYYNFSGGGAAENYARFSLGAEAPVLSASMRGIFTYTFAGYDFDSTTTNRNILSFGADYIGNYDRINFVAGFRTFSTSGSAEGNFFLYPNLHANVDLVPDRIGVFATFRGDVTPVTLRSLIDSNLFANPGQTLQNKSGYSVSGGISLNAGGKVAARAELGYQKVQGLPFFVSSPVDPPTFSALFDSASILSFDLSGSFRFSEALQAEARLLTRSFSLENLTEAYHMPKFMLQGGLRYKREEKLTLYGGFTSVGKRAATILLDTASQPKLAGYFDLYLGAEYRFTRADGGLTNTSIYLEGLNLLNRKYEEFSAYPVRGILLRGGIKYRLLPDGM